MSALFFDIDGTILSEITHEIPESALVALRMRYRKVHLWHYAKHRRTDIRHLSIPGAPYAAYRL